MRILTNNFEIQNQCFSVSFMCYSVFVLKLNLNKQESTPISVLPFCSIYLFINFFFLGGGIMNGEECFCPRL